MGKGPVEFAPSEWWLLPLPIEQWPASAWSHQDAKSGGRKMTIKDLTSRLISYRNGTMSAIKLSADELRSLRANTAAVVWSEESRAARSDGRI
jgi:hypothetical protein